MKEKLFGTKLFSICILICTGLAIWSCQEDELDPNGPDTRLEGKDNVVILHVNPKTKAEYTAEELAELSYNPNEEEYYSTSQKIQIDIWTQQKPLQVEIFKEGDSEPVIIIDRSKRNDRPDLGEYKDGYGYLTTWKTKADELGIPAESSQKFIFRVVYHDAGIDNFQTSSVRETEFTIHHYVPLITTTPVDFLVGYWNFNNPTNLLAATMGSDLTLEGAASHSAIEGVVSGDGAALVDVGSWYNVKHSMPAVGGNRVNAFSMVWDVKVSAADLGKYICLLQFNTANDSDGSVYIHPNGGFWFNGGPGGHAGGTIQADTWHRIALSVDAPQVIFYVDGVEVYSDDIASTDGKFSLDPEQFLILGENSSNDGNGEDNPIAISEFYLFNTALSGSELAGFPTVGTRAVDHFAMSLKGKWNFNNPANLLAAQVGNPLTLGGAALHSATDGVVEGDGAALVDIGTWYNVEDHGMVASGGERVNEFTMIWDVKVAEADLGKYICLLQYNTANDSDGSLYIHPNGGFWFNGGPGGHASGTIQADTWHRIVLSVNSPEVLFYVDGNETYVGEDLAATDGKFSLDPSTFLILGENSSNDGDGEDNPITISDFMVFDKAMDAEQIAKFGSVTEPAL